jgi:tetratricopeptide (TPR) repeat protein
MPQTIRHQDSSGNTLTLTAQQAYELARDSLQQGDHARALLQQVVELDPTHQDALNLLGMIHMQARQPVLAISCFEKAIALGEVTPKVAAMLACHLAGEGKRERALAYLLHILKSPQPVETAVQLRLQIAHSLNELTAFEAAIPHFREALRFPLAPVVKAQALNGLGHALVQLERFEEALPCFQAALLIPDDAAPTAERHCNLGMALGELGRFEDELNCYERALALAPTALTHLNYSLALLRQGDFAQGWREYEHRWGDNAPQSRMRRGFTQPLWDGGDISGQRILLHAEQGQGDTIQFVRYVPLVAARGATVILEVQPALKRLLSRLPGLSALIARGEPVPQFDVQCPLLSLPLAFRTTLETIPSHIPYIEPGEEARRAWEARHGRETNLKVGLVWAGSPSHKKDRTRSAPVECLAPLLGIRGVRFFSFQVGPRSADCERLKQSGQVTDLSPLLTDYNESAAALVQMDLLISVDTSVAHLGGALGLETWVLLPAIADWRWLIGRADSPWYPGMKLFRQTGKGDWSSVAEQVREQLQLRAARRDDRRSRRISSRTK